MKMVEVLKRVKINKATEESKNHKLRKVFRSSIFDILFCEITYEKKGIKEVGINTELAGEKGEIQDKNHTIEELVIEETEITNPENSVNIPFAGLKKQKGEEIKLKHEIDLSKIFAEIQEESPYNPETEGIDNNKLKKIFSGNIINPFAIKNPENTKNYSFFIICKNGINEDIRDCFWPASVKDFYKSSWFALVNTDGKSMIVIPNKGIVEYNPKTKSKILHKLEENVWDFGIRMFDLEKNFNTKIIKTPISNGEMSQIFTQVYGS